MNTVRAPYRSEEAVELGEPPIGQAKSGSIALGEHSPAAAADEEPEVVAEDGPGDRGRDHPPERQPAELGQRSAREQHRLPGHRQAGVFQKYANEHDRVSVSREEIDQPFRHRNAPERLSSEPSARLGLCYIIMNMSFTRRSAIVAFVAAILTVHPAAEEGMWTFDHPPTAAIQQRYGFTVTTDWLDHLRLSSVRFNDGGSGSFVSADGLVLTNHHVALGQLQKLSTEQKNYVADGFAAGSRRRR